MKALSLWQPWASMIRWQYKTIETRSWATTYRGPVAIHASKRWGIDQRAICEQSPYAELIYQEGGSLAFGAVLCLVNLFDVIPTEDVLANPLKYCPFSWDIERELGDYSSGRHAWKMQLIRVYPDPVPCRGFQGLWNWAEPIGAFSEELHIK